MNNGFSKQDFQGALVAMGDERLAYTPAVAFRNACSTGSAALYSAMDFIECGRGRIALVVGAEKMTSLANRGGGRNPTLCMLSCGRANIPGWFAGQFGRIAQAYFQRYGDRSEELAMIAAKNHANGAVNPYAHLRKDFGFDFCNTVSDKNPYVAAPLRRTTAR